MRACHTEIHLIFGEYFDFAPTFLRPGSVNGSWVSVVGQLEIWDLEDWQCKGRQQRQSEGFVLVCFGNGYVEELGLTGEESVGNV